MDGIFGKPFMRLAHIRRHWPLVACSLALFAGGCGKSEPARFHLNMVKMTKDEIPESQQIEIAEVLTAMFGTPDDPVVLPETGLNEGLIRMAAGPVGRNEQGGERGLYRRHCAHCHGISGDGAGPTAAFLNPYPRDYRSGTFKFTSTPKGVPPTHEDLERILKEGVAGTAMPSFKLLQPVERQAVIEYVKYLSMRGQAEIRLIDIALNEVDLDDDDNPLDMEKTREYLIDGMLAKVTSKWQTASSQIIQSEPDTRYGDSPPTKKEINEAIDRGRALFYGKGGCVKCHGESALGDGEVNDFDDWNKELNELLEKHDELTAEDLGTLPVRTIRPRNLRMGVYRGGRRPLDLYRRVHSGIKGAPMPGLGTNLTGNEYWDLIDYVYSLSREPTSQPPSYEAQPLNSGEVASH